ncbi:hypothetical protein OROHE_020474 [Orobanche hederae]
MAYAPIRKRKIQPDDDDFSCPPRIIRGTTLGDKARAWGREFSPLHILFECASGYALFLAHGIKEVDTTKFQAVEEYINRSPQPCELIDFQPFSSDDALALAELNAIYKSTLTDKLKEFLEKNLPHPIKNCYTVSTADSMLGSRIITETGLGVHSSVLIEDVMRGLRDKIDKLIGLEPGVLENAQLNLARLYNNQMCTHQNSVVVSSSSYLQEQVGVKPGEALYANLNLETLGADSGSKLNEDRTEVEYRVWDPLRSKLGAAILGGITNIWIKPGSRVLYVGNVCGLTVSNLSDLVGSDGLVYVVRFSDGDDVVDMAGKRLNVVTITEKYPYGHWHYRMLVGIVDVIFAEIDHCPDHPPGEQYCPDVNFIVNNAHFYLRAGGHYMISFSTQVNDNSTGHVKNPFTRYDRRREFKPIETFMLDGAYAMSVGGYHI